MAREVRMPRLAEDMEAGRIVEWLKRVGEPVTQGEPLLVVDSDKAEVEVESPATGIVDQILIPVGDDADVGTILALIGGVERTTSEGSSAAAPPPSGRSEPGDEAYLPEAAGPASAKASAEPTPGSADPSQPGRRPGRRPASPAARRLAQELGVDLASVAGSGADGLITESDVRASASPMTTADASAPRRVPVTGMRRRIAERLAESRRTAADVTTVNDVDMTDVAAAHASSGISYTAYVTWAAARALRSHPRLNASFGDGEIILKPAIHVGVAVSLPDGLVVPVVRHADTKSPAEIARDIEEVSGRIRAGDLRPEDVSGGTFTVTNSGGFGSLFFTPIIDLPEVAILGMGRIADAPVVRDGSVVVRKVMYLSLTYDHRAVDGADAVTFLVEVKRLLEQPPVEPWR